jgi:hypothetical protein
VICHAHGDTLEDLEQRGLPADSEQIVEAFHRHEDLLRRLALEKASRDGWHDFSCAERPDIASSLGATRPRQLLRVPSAPDG